jgi:hypothetical protein
MSNTEINVIDNAEILPLPEPDPEIVIRFAELNAHGHQRQIRYGKIENELDMLYKDIDAGLFGDAAKTGSFYLHIKSIKDDVPKVTDERKAELELELDALFANT